MTRSQSTRIGAIDCGSNAIRVVVADVRDGEPVTLAAERVPVRLGTRAFTRGELDRETMDQAVTAFRGFRALFDAHGVARYRAVATSALRNAHDRDILVHRLYHEAGIELEVIDGEEEARLVRKAVGHAFIGHAAPQVILDLGGGSLEIALRESDGWRNASLPVGTVRLIETFDLPGAIGHEEAGMVRRYTASLLRTVPIDLAGENRWAAACGGNADALARLFGTADDRGLYSLELRALEDALPALMAATVDERMARFQVRRDRAEVMAVAALVLATVCRGLRLERFAAPGVGIRDALLLDLAEQRDADDHQVESAHGKSLITAAHTFAQRMGYDLTHGEHVRALARSLFDQLTDVHRLPPELGVLLEIAALLHDIGEVVNPRAHHKHSEYLVRWGRIPGLDEPLREMLAILVRTHRKSPPDTAKHPGFAAMSETRRHQVLALAAILRLADALDTEHRQAIDDVVVSRMGDTVTLDLLVADARVAATVARGPLLRKAHLFEQIFGYRVGFTIGTGARLRDPSLGTRGTGSVRFSSRIETGGQR